MTTSRLLPGSFLAVAALLSGLTVATAQTTPKPTPEQAETTVQTSEAKCMDIHKSHGNRGGRGMFGHFMKKADTDGDGSVTQADIDTFRAGVVEDADTSGDGNISLDEFESIYQDMVRERLVDTFQNLDADGDGIVTQAEMDQRFGNVVERMDRNKDGKLDREDHRGKRGDKGPERGAKGHERGDKGPERDGNGHGKRHGDCRG